MKDIRVAMYDYTRWEKVKRSICDLPISEQLQYADYVTKKVSRLPKRVLVPYIVDTVIPSIPKSYRYEHPSVIGNDALLIISLPDGDLKRQALRRFRLSLI